MNLLQGTDNLINKSQVEAYVYNVIIKLVEEQYRNDEDAFFRKTVVEYAERFLDKLDAFILPPANDYWCYRVYMNYSGISLYYEHYNSDDLSHLYVDCRYLLFKEECRYLTTEEYAEKHGNVEMNTVRQWVKRGKLRCVRKEGPEWRISELEDKPQKRTYNEYVWYNDGSFKDDVFNRFTNLLIEYDNPTKKVDTLRFTKKDDTIHYRNNHVVTSLCGNSSVVIEDSHYINGRLRYEDENHLIMEVDRKKSAELEMYCITDQRIDWCKSVHDVDLFDNIVSEYEDTYFKYLNKSLV